MTPEFEDLCNRVEAIDPEAGKWLREVAPIYDFGPDAPDSFSPTGALNSCMIWRRTPQGVSFWSKISTELGEWN